MIPEEKMGEKQMPVERYRSGEIFGTMIESANLALVVDFSPSMQECLPTVIATIIGIVAGVCLAVGRS